MLFTQARQNKMNNRTVQTIYLCCCYSTHICAYKFIRIRFFFYHFHRVHLIPMNQNNRLARAIEINKEKLNVEEKTQPKTVSNNNQLIIVLRFFPLLQ